MGGEHSQGPQRSQAGGFAQLRLGQTFAGGDRLVTEQDLAVFATVSGDRHPLHTDAAYAKAQGFAAPILHGPFGLAAFFGWFHELGLARDSIVALLDTHWHYLEAIHVGDHLRFEMTITRLRRSSSGRRGVVGRHVRILNQDGKVVQEGTTAVLVHAPEGAASPGQELFTRAWADSLAARLNAHAAFQAATATWDGTLGLACGEEEIQLRIYRGKVLEAATRTPNGATFTVVASELTWVAMISGTSSDFMKKAMQGDFSVRGNAYEYLRFTKAVGLVVDNARALFHAESPA